MESFTTLSISRIFGILTVEEISRRLLLEHLLWAESERSLVEVVRTNLAGA